MNLKKEKQKKQNKGLIIALMILPFLVLIGALVIDKASAYFLNNENSYANTCRMGTLDFSLISSGNSPTNQTISVVSHGSLTFQYNIQAQKISGDNGFCNALSLQAKLDNELKYDGNLMSIDLYPSVVIGDSGQDDWLFTITLPNEFYDKTCEFKFIFDGWQTNIAVSAMGFSDKEEITNSLSSQSGDPEVEVIYPNGGEVWYAVPPGMAIPGLGQYEILWQAQSPIYNQNQLGINIWYCKESGNDCFYKITESGSTENDGKYWWTIPYDVRFVGDDARIKIVANDPGGLWGQDMSDADFCPPMLTISEMLAMLASIELPPGDDPLPILEITTSSNESIFNELTY